MSKAPGRRPAPTDEPTGQPLLTAREAAAILTIPISRIYDEVQQDRLSHLRLGTHKGLRFYREHLDQWLADKAVEAGNRPGQRITTPIQGA